MLIAVKVRYSTTMPPIVKSSVIYQKHVSRFLKILQENDIKNVVSIGFNVKIKMQKVIKPANIVRFWSMFHRLKDNDIPKTAVSKSRIPQNELIRVFDKSPTTCNSPVARIYFF